MASSAICASTCSTWCAGCWAWDGPGESHPPEEFWWIRGARPTYPTPRPRPSTSAIWTSCGSTAPGARKPIPTTPGAPTIYGDKGTLKLSVYSYDFIPLGGGTPIHKDVVYELEQYPENKTEKDLERHVAPAIRRHMLDFVAAIQSRGKPVADIEEGHISTASCILANLALQLGRTLTWDAENGRVRDDEEANRLLRRPYRRPWIHAEVETA